MRSCRFSILLTLAIFAGLMIFPRTDACAQYPIEVRIDTATVWLGTEELVLDVYLTHTQDTISALLLGLQLGADEFIRFPGFSQSAYEVSGTLLEDWPRFFSSYVDQNATLLQLAAFADTGVSFPTAGLEPQGGVVPLLRLRFQEQDSPFSDTGGVTGVGIPGNFLNFFQMHDIHGERIGVVDTTIIDTNYFRCTAWAGSDCVDWEPVSVPPYDSIEVVEEQSVTLDTHYVSIEYGFFSLVVPQCGDVTGDNLSDLGDVLTMAGYVFLGGTPPPVTWVGNVDGSPDGVVDLADVLYLAGAVFLGGSPVDCQEQ